MRNDSNYFQIVQEDDTNIQAHFLLTSLEWIESVADLNHGRAGDSWDALVVLSDHSYCPHTPNIYCVRVSFQFIAVLNVLRARLKFLTKHEQNELSLFFIFKAWLFDPFSAGSERQERSAV